MKKSIPVTFRMNMSPSIRCVYYVLRSSYEFIHYISSTIQATANTNYNSYSTNSKRVWRTVVTFAWTRRQ